MSGIRHSEQALLRELGIGGVIPPGSLAWDTYPQAAVGHNFSALAPDTDAAYQTIIAANAITTPYTPVAAVGRCYNGGTTAFHYSSAARVRLRLAPSAAVIRSGLGLYGVQDRTSHYTGFGGIAFDPYWVDANAALEWTVADDLGLSNAGVWHCYLTVLKRQPVIVPELLRSAHKQTVSINVNDIGGTSCTASGTVWAYGAYSEMHAGFTTPVLITKILVRGQYWSQVEIATGAAASEVPLGIFGLGDSRHYNYSTYSLRPYPLLLPANTRLAVRGRSATASAINNVNFEYIPLPLAA